MPDVAHHADVRAAPDARGLAANRRAHDDRACMDEGVITHVDAAEMRDVQALAGHPLGIEAIATEDRARLDAHVGADPHRAIEDHARTDAAAGTDAHVPAQHRRGIHRSGRIDFRLRHRFREALGGMQVVVELVGTLGDDHGAPLRIRARKRGRHDHCHHRRIVQRDGEVTPVRGKADHALPTRPDEAGLPRPIQRLPRPRVGGADAERVACRGKRMRQAAFPCRHRHSRPIALLSSVAQAATG